MTKYKKFPISESAIVGVAVDEPERVARLISPDRSLLAENNITEAECFDICRKYNLLSPLYDIPGISRGGCFFCPNYTKAERDYVKDHEPGLYRLLQSVYKDTVDNWGIESEYMELIHRRSNWGKEFKG